MNARPLTPPGSGVRARLRGAGIFGLAEGAKILEPVFALFKDWGLGGVTATNSRATGGTDSTS